MTTKIEQAQGATETREAYETPVAQKVGRIDDVVGNSSTGSGSDAGIYSS